MIRKHRQKRCRWESETGGRGLRQRRCVEQRSKWSVRTQRWICSNCRDERPEKRQLDTPNRAMKAIKPVQRILRCRPRPLVYNRGIHRRHRLQRALPDIEEQRIRTPKCIFPRGCRRTAPSIVQSQGTRAWCRHEAPAEPNESRYEMVTVERLT